MSQNQQQQQQLSGNHQNHNQGGGGGPPQLTPLDNFRVQTQMAKSSTITPSSASKDKPLQAHQPLNTTNVTLNMNFNMQQSTIQMQSVNPVDSGVRVGPDGIPSHQRIFHSPRQSQGTMQTMIQQQQQQNQMTPQQQYSKNISTIVGREVQNSGKLQSHTSKKPSQLNRSEDIDQIGVSSARVKMTPGSGSPPVHPGGKVKKMKVNKLNSDQLNQVRMHQQHSKAGSASLQSTSHAQILHQEPHPTTLGRNSTQATSPLTMHNSNQQQLQQQQAQQQQQQQQQLFAQQAAQQQLQQQQQQHVQQQMGMLSPQGQAQLAFMHQQQHLAQQQQHMHLKSRGRQIQAAHNLQKQGLPPASHLSPHKDQNTARMEQSDSKLGRKGERPTVAQILEIGVSSSGQNWMDEGAQMNGMQQPAQAPRQSGGLPIYNQTTTSNFDSLNSANMLGSITHTQKQSKNLKAASNMFFEEVRLAPTPAMQTPKVANSNPSLDMPQFKSVKNAKSRSRDMNQSSQGSGIQSMYAQDPINFRRKIDSPHDSTATSLQTNSINQQQTRNMQRKMHYSEQGRLPPQSPQYAAHQQQQPQMQQQQQQQAAYMPMLVDLNNRNGSAQQQLFSRLQQQFLEQSAVIRHPQMGELPVISMTQQQLNSMIQQAAQRQNMQYQQQQSSQQNSANNGSYQPPMGVPPGMGAQQPQMAFAIQIQQEPTAKGRGPISHTQVGSPMNGPQQHAFAAQAQQQQPQQQYQNNLFLPSLRQQNQVQPQQPQHTTPQSQTVPNIQSPHGGYQGSGAMLSEAPIKKMTLNSRGKSVPRSSVRTDPENGQNLLETIQSHHINQNSSVGPNNGANRALRQQNQYQHQQQINEQIMMQQQHQHHQNQQQQHQLQQQHQHHNDGGHPPMISVGNLTTSFINAHGAGNLQPLAQVGDHMVHAQDAALQDPNQQQNSLIPLARKGPRNSMTIRGPGGDSTLYVGSQGNISVQSHSRRQANSKQQYAAGPSNVQLSQRGQSRNLATQSDRSSQRAATQGGNINMISVQGGAHQYMQQKGPLSDLILTQQSNLNEINRQRGSALRKAKRNKSSITVNTNCDPHGEIQESSTHDVNGGVPYIFENQKINQAIAQEELKQLPMDLHHQLPNASMMGEYMEHAIANQHAQQELCQVPEPKKTKKGKGRKNLQSSQRDKGLQSQGSRDAVRFGQRQLSQQPPSIPGMIQNLAQQNAQHIQQQMHHQVPGSMMQNLKGDKRKKGFPNEILDHAQYYNHEQTVIQPAVANAGPANLKPNMQLKRSPVKKESNSQINSILQSPTEVPPGTEPSLAQHGMFMKTLAPACTKYYKSKNNSRMTPHKYRNGISTRLLVARETFAPKRAKLPIMVMNLDGVLGYFDEAKHYHCKEKYLTMLQSLSHNFKIIGFSSESKGLITRFGKCLSEFKAPFAFDAIYQIQRKPTQNQNRVNLTHIILDFSGDDEEDLDLFVSSQIILLTVDYNHLNEKFESMDLREVFDFDKEYLKGAKAPLIIRVPHARCRPQSSMVFEMLFQLLTCLLVCSKMGNCETTSFFTYNDRTKGLNVPTSDKAIVSTMIPEKLKFVEKAIQASKSLRFVMADPQHGFNLHKGFKMLSEVYRGSLKPDWLEFHYRIFKPLLPIRMRLQKITQIALQGAQPPTGKKLMVRCDNEEATRKYQVFAKKNEIVRKHIRKYRARYWAVNQIEDTNLEEENQDMVGDLLDNALVANTLGDEVPETTPAPTNTEKAPPEKVVEEPVPAAKEPAAADTATTAEGGTATATNETATAPKDQENVTEEQKQFKGGDCSSSSEVSDSDNDHYDEEAQAVKFKIIDIKQTDEREGPALRKQQTMKQVDPHRFIKLDIRKIQKPKHQFLLDFCSKKQNPMLFTTNQQQHLIGAQALQIEANIAELVQKLNDQEKTGKKEVVNYDF